MSAFFRNNGLIFMIFNFSLMFRKSRDIFLIITGFIFQIFMMKVNMKPTSIKLRNVNFE